MSGDSIAFACAIPQRHDGSHEPALLAGFADAERIEGRGAIIPETRRGAGLRAEAHP